MSYELLHTIIMDSKFFDLFLEFEEYSLDLDIHTSASIGADERIHDIIENSENKCIVNEQNKKGWTPLMYAACCANLKVVLLLMEEGAETGLKNNDGHTALILASKCGSGDVVNLLLDSGANVNDRDARGWTALFHAAAFGHRSVVQLLIERAAVVDLVDDEARITPLMLAAAAGHEMIVKDFLQIGVNVHVESVSGETARSLAAMNGHINIKHLIDAHYYPKKKNPTPNVQCPDLISLLKELQLTKYYHIFESHGIDLNTFWLLTDDDLKEIGIQILGPRKKICLAISQYHQERSLNNSSRDAVNVDNFLMENKKLLQLVEKLKSAVLHEKNLRTTAERSLADGFQSLKNYRDSIQCSVGRAVNLVEKMKENHEYLRNLLCSSLHGMNFSTNFSKSKMDHVVQSLECMRKLIDIQHQNMASLQRLDFQKFSSKKL